MNKPLEYYLSLPYTREVIPDPTGVWFVRVKELPGCFSQGKTPEEAMRMMDDAMRGWIEVSLEDGDQIPEPRPDEEFSGKFVMRLPKTLHRQLSETADKEGVSLNTFCNTALAKEAGMGPKSANLHGKGETASVLESIFGNLCQAADLVVPEETDSETTFSNWIDLEVGQIAHSINTENIKSAKKILNSIEFLFRTHGKKSPFLASMAELAAQMGDVIEWTEKSEMSEKVSFDVNDYINKSNKDLFSTRVPEQQQKPSSPLKQSREKTEELYMEILETVKGEPYGRH